MKFYTAAALGRVLSLGEDEIKTLTARGVITDGYVGASAFSAGNRQKETRTGGSGATGGGLYVLEESAREIIAALKRPEARDGSVDYATERARLARAKREAEEHKLGLMERELHRSEEIELAISKILVGFKAKLRALPSRFAPQCAKKTNQEEIHDLLKETMDEVLQDLSDLDKLFEEE